MVLHVLNSRRAMRAHVCVSSGTASVAMQWRAARLNGPARIAEALGLGLLTIVAMFVLSWYFGACVDVPEWHTVRLHSLCECSQMPSSALAHNCHKRAAGRINALSCGAFKCMACNMQNNV